MPSRCACRIPGQDLPHVHTLRTLADSRAIIAQAATARRAVVIGASFIGLEVAASLRTRGIEVHVVAPEKRPLERVLGPQLGDFVRQLHEEHGVIFHLGDTASAIDARQVTLNSGGTHRGGPGGGRRRRAAAAGARREGRPRARPWRHRRRLLQTSAPGIYAAGDIARWPDPHSGEAIRVEHWVVAERQGQTAALNMLGGREKFDAVPFFWSQHYDVPINYVGHAETLGRHRDRRRHRGPRLRAAVHAPGPRAGGCLDLSRCREPGGRSTNGARRPFEVSAAR